MSRNYQRKSPDGTLVTDDQLEAARLLISGASKRKASTQIELKESTLPKNIPKVISVKGKKLVRKIVSADRDQAITLVNAMSATGNILLPTFIFPLKIIQEFFKQPRLIHTELFKDYLRHFKTNVQPTKDIPVMLILYNNSSHIFLATVNICRDNSIHMLTLPSHSSHKMQPLDRGFLRPLKIKFAYECDKWLNHPGRVIGQLEKAHFGNETFQKAALLINAVSGYKVSGIWPLDRDIFTDEYFAATSVTDMIPVTNSEKTAEAGCSNTQQAKELEQEPLCCVSQHLHLLSLNLSNATNVHLLYKLYR